MKGLADAAMMSAGPKKPKEERRRIRVSHSRSRNFPCGHRNFLDSVRQHAYLMNNLGDWRLAPAFDLTFSNGPGGEHYMAVLGEGRNITREHVEKLAKVHGVSPKRTASI